MALRASAGRSDKLTLSLNLCFSLVTCWGKIQIHPASAEIQASQMPREVRDQSSASMVKKRVKKIIKKKKEALSK